METTPRCLCVALLCWIAAGAAALPTVEQKLKEDSDLSQFYDLLVRNTIANFTLHNRQMTLFAPTNAAFQRYKGRQDDLILYHMTNLAKTVDQFGTSMSSELEGNPPLWVSIKKETHMDQVYINNARVILNRSNYIAMNQGKRQVLHVIDEVLEPIQSQKTTSTPVYNPSAYQLVNQSESLDIGLHRLRTFRQKVNDHSKREDFVKEGRYTYFIPVDEGFMPANRAEMIDAKVIDGHVVPDKVLFTSATHTDEPYPTMAFGDGIKVTVAFTPGSEEGQVHVRSNTVMGDSKHASGVVLAQIVKANIPVRNGVVHLISRPLMVVDTSITEWLESQKEDGPATGFLQILKDTEVGRQFMSTVTRLRDGTLFVPSNHALLDDNLRNILRNPDRMREIFNLHLVKDQRLSVEQIKKNNMNQIFQVPTAADRKHLYFNIVSGGHTLGQTPGEEVLTVEGGGVNATCVQANIAATNGIVHIIDRVLGVPQTTVLDKLKQDPMLNDTYHLSRMAEPAFLRRLNDTEHKYTYFVPRDKAWRRTEIQMPSVYKKLFMPQFAYHTTHILERHLVISDVAYTMERMKQMANDTSYEVHLPALRGQLRFRIEEKDKSFTLIWNTERIHVFRPDVECTNGVIHVIDTPFLNEEDVRITGSPAASRSVAASRALLLVVAVAATLLRPH